ncbi:hypothetical protein [Micromonospora sp. KC213]|uniref:hypothetical protein n=1 Tax=Micromonospora sp. KC213 TaxID=2530378 RepID=UPI0010485004|nr:hypothetical protein [Micromonospora sp. KC213]TDC38723.1 hypothetical protein E1166_17980 [Micromonospora sp. KC213]
MTAAGPTWADDRPGTSELDVIRLMASDVAGLADAIESAPQATRPRLVKELADYLAETAARCRWLAAVLAHGVDLAGTYADESDYATERPMIRTED